MSFGTIFCVVKTAENETLAEDNNREKTPPTPTPTPVAARDDKDFFVPSNPIK